VSQSSGAAPATAPAAVPVPAATIVDALEHIDATHVVVVPDTNQRTVLQLLDERGAPSVVRAATEDDVLGICAGLWIAGQRPVAMIQQLGIFASVNSLRGLTYDLAFPLAIVAGLYGRDVAVRAADSPRTSVRLCTPVLDALDVPWVLVERPSEAARIEETLERVFREQRTAVVLLGAPTS
jgi:sulfopyruvate decarboxylase subunit alpha